MGDRRAITSSVLGTLAKGVEKKVRLGVLGLLCSPVHKSRRSYHDFQVIHSKRFISETRIESMFIFPTEDNFRVDDRELMEDASSNWSHVQYVLCCKVIQRSLSPAKTA